MDDSINTSLCAPGIDRQVIFRGPPWFILSCSSALSLPSGHAQGRISCPVPGQCGFLAAGAGWEQEQLPGA